MSSAAPAPGALRVDADPGEFTFDVARRRWCSSTCSVAAVFEGYERALREADVAVLTELFWDDPRCVRYGVGDRQHGAAEIAARRREHPGVPPGRTLSGTVVLPLGRDAAVVSTLFGYPGRSAEGRQTRTWARTADGWRIVAAHVSEVPSAPYRRAPP